MRQGILDPQNRVISDLWVDAPEALQHLDVLAGNRIVSEPEAAALESFIEEGYCLLDLGLDAPFCDSVDAALQDLLSRRPGDLLAASTQLNAGRPQPMSAFPDGFRPSPGFRILDAHSHVDAFQKLIAHPLLHRFASLVLRQTPVATQSLYFLYGSTQSLHRDPWYVVTTPIASMLAVWIALEDISPQSGPLSYVPGSHRLPYKPLSTGDIIFHGAGVTQQDRSEHVDQMWADIRAHGMKVRYFTPKRGQALVWHSSLVHGGSRVDEPGQTRKSFVIHFDALRNHPRHAQTVVMDGGEPRVYSTRRIHHRNGCLWFGNPLAEGPG